MSKRVAVRRTGSANGLLTGLVSYWELDEANGTRYDAHGTNDLTDGNSLPSNTGKVNALAADWVRDGTLRPLSKDVPHGLPVNGDFSVGY